MKDQGKLKNIIAAFLILSFITPSAICQLRNSVPVDVKNNRTYVTIKIGRLLIPNILLDTGLAFDGLMIFNQAYKDSLDLDNAYEIQIGGAGSGPASNALMIDSVSFTLGDTKMIYHPLIILLGNAGFFANGIIGYSIFGHHITEFDYDNGTMTLSPPDQKIDIDSGWTCIPLYFKNNHIPWLDASVVIENGKPLSLSMYIDYAAGDEIVLLEKPDMKFSLPAETEKDFLGKGLSGDIYGKTGYISKLIIGPYELQHIKASFAPATIRSKQENADAILGNESLRRFNIIFDYQDRKLYLKPNTHFNHSSR